MKRVFMFALACLLTFALTACGNGNEEPGGNGSDEAGSQGAASGEIVLGQLVTVNSVTPLQVEGVTLAGSQHSEAENAGGCSSFYLNEWIDVYVDSDFAGGDSAAQVYCVPHSDEIQGSFEEYAFLCEFTQPAEGNSPNFSGYVAAPDYAPGNYDLIFTYDGQVAYYMVIEILPESV